MMRVLVIGGTGFIGPYVARELCQPNHEVTLYHRGDHETVLAPGARHFKSEKAAMPVVDFPQELLGAGFETVIHRIAMGERDARAVVRAFTGRAQRLVVLSSGDVYRAYGRFTRIEPGPIEEGLLTEESPLRRALFPYRTQANSASDLNYLYERFSSNARLSDKPICRRRFFACPKSSAREATRPSRPSTEIVTIRPGAGHMATWRTLRRRLRSRRFTRQLRAASTTWEKRTRPRLPNVSNLCPLRLSPALTTATTISGKTSHTTPRTFVRNSAIRGVGQRRRGHAEDAGPLDDFSMTYHVHDISSP